MTKPKSPAHDEDKLSRKVLYLLLDCRLTSTKIETDEIIADRLIKLIEAQTRKDILDKIDKLAKKVKAVQVDIGEYDKFISVHDLKKELEAQV